jgi:hypothetical protein
MSDVAGSGVRHSTTGAGLYTRRGTITPLIPASSSNPLYKNARTMRNQKSLRLILSTFLLAAAVIIAVRASAGRPESEGCWCCYKTGNGELVATHVIHTTPGDCKKKQGRCYATQTQAQTACAGGNSKCWCCYFDHTIDQKKLVYTTSGQCAGLGGTCYDFQSQAQGACK